MRNKSLVCGGVNTSTKFFGVVLLGTVVTLLAPGQRQQLQTIADELRSHGIAAICQIDFSSPAGTVVTLLGPEQQPQLQNIADELHIDIAQRPEPAVAEPLGSDAGAEAQRRRLDELWNLY